MIQHTDLLAKVTNWLVIVVQNDTDFVHKSDLLYIVTVECFGAGIDIGKESEDVGGGDGFQTGRGDGFCFCDGGSHIEVYSEQSLVFSVLRDCVLAVKKEEEDGSRTRI